MNPEHFQLSRREIENRLLWYNNKYGPVIQKRGIQNWKNLFHRPNIYEWTILFMLILALFMGWAYQRDFKVYEENIQQHCCDICKSQTESIIQQEPLFKGNLLFNEENSKEEEVT